MKIPKTWRFANRRYHFVSEVVDADETVVVSKYWARNRWNYEATVKPVLEYQIRLEKGG